MASTGCLAGCGAVVSGEVRETVTSERSGRPVGRLRPPSIPVLAAVVAGLAVLLAMVSAGSRARVGRGPSPGSAAVQVTFDAVELLSLVALLGGLALLVLGLPRVRGRRRDPDEPQWVVERPPVPWYARLLLLLVVLALLGGLAGALLALRHRFEEQPASPPVPTAPPPPRLSSPSSPAPPAGAGRPGAAALPAVAVWTAVAVAAAAAAAGGVALWARSRPAPPALEEALRAVAPPALEEALRLSLEDLRHEPDPRRAIVAAYARMLAVLGRLGLPRRVAEAPVEYLRRVLGGLHGDPGPARRLTDLFELAEFSRQPVTEAMRDEAVQALGAMRDRLGAEA